MLTEERQKLILDRLRTSNIVKTRDLIVEIDVSESTIRRDLQEMEQDGRLKRIHGGARRILKLESELDMKEKSFKNVQEKKSIAEYAASLIANDEFVYLDAGTTTYEMIPFLEGKEIHVITNSVYHASAAADLGLMTIMIGGHIRNQTKAAVNPTSIAQIQGYYFDKAFMGTNGIHPEYGYTTVDSDEAATKSAAMTQSQHVFMLTDSTKFNKVNFSRIASIEEATIITDDIPNETKEKIKLLTTVKEVN